ncbi:hypothetical protein [Peribacillus simplex]|uniref:hypothetical protein n=1 Tax=Peribacillus simplex TaxID=1478 RepID=UPI003D05C47F
MGKTNLLAWLLKSEWPADECFIRNVSGDDEGDICHSKEKAFPRLFTGKRLQLLFYV